jgi:hypothetical protein
MSLITPLLQQRVVRKLRHGLVDGLSGQPQIVVDSIPLLLGLLALFVRLLPSVLGSLLALPDK